MEKTKSIYQKLLACQKELGAVKKGKENPYFKSRYADINDYLAVVKPILTKNGLILLQPISGTDLKTILIEADTGEKIETEATMPVNPDPQKQGSIITYFRRYAIQALLSLEAEDDDANKGSEGDNKYPPSAKQLTYLKTLLTKAGYKDDQAKFRYLTDTCNMLIVDWNELTAKQASQAIDALLKPELDEAEYHSAIEEEGKQIKAQEKIIQE